jgi:hypothetical protein
LNMCLRVMLEYGFELGMVSWFARKG